MTGSYEMDIQTWVPTASFLSRMRTYFIGGSEQLSDVTYQAIPKGVQV
jgi:hypothetical protein